MHNHGWKSRKLWLAVLTMALVVFGYGMTGFEDDLFGEYCMALIAAAGVYSGSAALEVKKNPPPPAA